MIKMKQMVIGGTMLAMSLSVAGQAAAQVRGDKAVYFTFSAPVALPNTTLPAGKYLFRLADSLVNRQIVQVYSADGSKLHAMLMTLPQLRPQPANNAELRFLETPANQPPAVANYWYPVERYGWEFIYPREQARQLAATSKSNVLTTAENNTSTDMRSGDLVRVSPTGEQVPASADAEAPAFTESARTVRGERADDAPDPAASAANAPAAARAPMTAQSSAQPASSAQSAQSVQMNEREALPATASAVPAAGLAGTLACLAAFAMRLRRTRRV
jgi:hypothetical protein